MAFIHDRRECLTGCQDRAPWAPGTDLQYDFIMVYGTDASMPERIREYRRQGYVVHLMTGCAWGDYREYLDGEWDGENHWDESQCDRRGEPIMHGVGSPYFCPTPAFGRYLLDRLRPAVEEGVEAIHLEEPEFWDAGGYSPAFRRAWKDFYGEDWRPPHESMENRYRASALKVFLYRRLLTQVSEGLKVLAKARGRELAVYVPTHSLINYTQWKILSPEGTLLDVPTVDGFIAQVWTGTSRAGNVYRGRYGERTFETAFLEYGIMQELVRGNGRTMWFLHDPVEDNPEYTWDNFRENYLKTLAASLMHPGVSRYEVMPWPDRVINGVYPKKGRLSSVGFVPGTALEGARPIPRDYAELLSALIRTLGDMEQPDARFLPDAPRVGLVMADSALYQRSFSDDVPSAPGGPEAVNRLLVALMERQRANEDTSADSAALMGRIADDPRLYNDYAASGAFPHFFGLAMPLIKAGLPLRTLLFENILRNPACLDSFSALILSYEWMKPRDPETHEALASWVRRGGLLLLVGDGTDPCHAVSGWWNGEGRGFSHPAQHLCTLLGLPRDPEEGTYACGEGRAAVLRTSPASLTLSTDASEAYLHRVLSLAAPDFEPRNAFVMKRGPYRAVSVMEESVSSEALTLEGCFADLFAPGFPVVRRKVVPPGGTALLFDLADPDLPAWRPVASTARIESMERTENGFRLRCRIAEGIRIRMLLKLPSPVRAVRARREDGGAAEPETCEWNDSAGTLFISFPAGIRSAEICLVDFSDGRKTDA